MNCHLDFADDDPVCRAIGLGAAALRYATWGYAVLPLARGGKKPHRMLGHEGGVHHATVNQAAIWRWWESDPAANIGIATGTASRLVVVDLDVKHDADGITAFRDFLGAFGLAMPPGPWVRTPSGGAHMWLHAGGRVPERPGVLPGVDVKGDGGYVLAPPSMKLTAALNRPGEPASQPVPLPYQWQGCFCGVPSAPAWMSQWLASAPSSGSVQPGWGSGEGEVDFETVRAGGIEKGRRNRELYRLACSRFRVHRKDSSAVLGELHEVWSAGDTSDLPWREVLVIAESARKFIDRQVAREREIRDMWLRRDR